VYPALERPADQTGILENPDMPIERLAVKPKCRPISGVVIDPRAKRATISRRGSFANASNTAPKCMWGESMYFLSERQPVG
jgi:hypothetical protein